MLADMAAVTAVDARSMAASTVPVNSAAVSTPSATCAGSITPPTSINPPISALAGIYAYYDDYGCWRWFPIRESHRRVWVC